VYPPPSPYRYLGNSRVHAGLKGESGERPGTSLTL
jgi:hypothetical protein